MSAGSGRGPFTAMSDDDARLAATLALTHLPSVGVSRARWLMSELEPAAAFQTLRAGSVPVSSLPTTTISNQRRLFDQWIAASRDLDPAEMLANHRAFPGLSLMDAHHPQWPFANDPEPPVLLFALGDTTLLAPERAVAIVGTRRCSTVGARVAHEMGRDLSRAGVKVVSGLALGIDAAAHHGAAQKGAASGSGNRIGVVASGLDVPYPKRNSGLWADIANTGVLITEAGLGTEPERWRFPARNRLIAALSDAVVVVESHESGGSLLTVDEAATRDVEVLAVPGSVLSSSCVGSNQLLMDGCAPVRCGQDVLDVLGVDAAATSGTPLVDSRQPLESPGGLVGQILAEVTHGPVHIDALVGRTGETLSSVLIAVQQLASQGSVTFEGSRVDAA